MREISDKALTFLLIAAIIVSVGGTIISLNTLNRLIPRITGLGTTTTGLVNVSLASVASITIVDSQIDFGSCAPAATYGLNVTSNTSTEPSACSAGGGTWPDNITVKNDGNTNLNVTVKTNVIASTFISGADPYGPLFMFSVRNASNYPGCNNITGIQVESGFDGSTGMQWDWRNFTAANTEYPACINLTPTTDYHSIYVFAKIFIPADTPQATDANATLTFTAHNW